MQIDPRLNDIDDCLYRVAARVLIVQDGRVLLVKEAIDGDWWGLPGGGVDHGETIESSLVREVEEELGVPAGAVVSDFEIVHYQIGGIMNAVPRMNLYFKAAVPEGLIKKTEHVAAWGWFTRDAFLKAKMHTSYNKPELARIIFGN